MLTPCGHANLMSVVGDDWTFAVQRKSHLLMITLTNDTANVRWEQYLTNTLLLKTTNYIQYEIP